MQRLSPVKLDKLCFRVKKIEAEAEAIRDDLKRQVAEYGFIPPRSDRSRRLLGEAYEATLSTSTSLEVHDSEVERIKECCPANLFAKLFWSVTKWKICGGATEFLAGPLGEDAPRNLRTLFAKAVVVKESTPRLSIKQRTDTEQTQQGQTQAAAGS